MATVLNPYLNFRSDARAAMEFYRSVFGGELTVSTFAEGGMSQEPDTADLVMHSMLVTGKGLTLMGADVPPSMDFNPGNNISVSLSGEDETELRGYWDGLAEGATVFMPLEKAPWGDVFGMLSDKYGVQWLVNINGAGNTNA